MQMQIGDIIKITQLDRDVKYLPTTYTVVLVKGNKLFISTEDSPDIYSSLYYSKTSNKWKITGSNLSFQIDFMTKYGFTEIPEIDMKILAKLDLKSLSNVCQSNKYLDSLCQDDYFWHLKTSTDMPDTLKYQNILWKKHYMLFYKLKISVNSLFEKIKSGELNVVKYLVKHGVDPAAKNNRAIFLASADGHLDILEYLTKLPFQYGIRANSGTIRWASLGGHLKVVKYLMNLPAYYGIDPSVKDNIIIKKLFSSKFAINRKQIMDILIRDQRVVSLLRLSNYGVSKKILSYYGL